MGDTKRIGRDLTVGPIFPLLMAFVAPLLLANLLQQLYDTVDMVVIGLKLGNSGTVGVSTGGEVATVITFIATAFGSASQVYIAQLSGAKDHRSISEAIVAVIAVTGTMGLLAMAGCLLFCGELLDWLNCPAQARQQAQNYMMIVSLGLPFVFGYNAICGILRGLGESKRPLLFISIAAVSNIVMDLLLVLVIQLEAAGTAIATVIAQIASFTASAVYLFRHREAMAIDLSPGKLRVKGKHVRVLLRLGIPLAAQSALIHCTQLICTRHVNLMGMVASSTNSIGNKISKFVNVFTNSVNNGAGAMVGQNIGARQYDRVEKVVKTTLKTTLLIACVLSAMALLIPCQIFSLFTKDREVIEFGRVYMRSCVIVFFLASIQGAFTSVITGVGFARLNFIIGVLDGVILRLGISFFLAYTMQLGVVGFFYGNALARLGPATIGIIYYFSKNWKKRRLLTDS